MQPDNQENGEPKPMRRVSFLVTVLALIIAPLLAVLSLRLPGNVDQQYESAMTVLALAFGFTLLVLIFMAGTLVLWNIFTGKINLSQLLCDEAGDASMARFQFLIFTFVVAFSFFFVVAKEGKLPGIPTEVLALLGISATTYAVGKGIDQSTPEADPKTADGEKKDPKKVET